MRKPVTDPTQARCGNCQFWDKIETPNDGQVMGACGGLPFQVLLLGMVQSRFVQGQVEMKTEMVRPNVPETLPPCALYRGQNIPILGPTSRLAS